MAKSTTATIWRRWPFLLLVLSVPIIPFVTPLPFPWARVTVFDVMLVAALVARGAEYLTHRNATVVLPPKQFLWSLVAVVGAFAVSGVFSESTLVAAREVAQLICVFALLLLVQDAARTKADVRLIIEALVLSATLIAAYSIGESLLGLGSSRFDGFHTRAMGPTLNPNTLGAYLGAVFLPVVSLLVADRRRSPWLVAYRIVCCVLMALAVLLTMSRGAWVALLPCALIWIYLSMRGSHKRRLAVLTVVLVALVGSGLLLNYFAADTSVVDSVLQRAASLGSSDRSVVARVKLQQAALSMFLAHPWLGVGPGHYEIYLPEYAPSGLRGSYNMPHNVLAHVASETGLLGLLAFCGFLFACGREAVRHLRRLRQAGSEVYQLYCAVACGALFVLVTSLFGHPFAHAVQEPWMILIGLLFAIPRAYADARSVV